jgi:hypothetical protein
VGPTPEQRAFLAPLVIPRGSSEPELGWPGIIKKPFDAVRGALQKAEDGAEPSELVPGMTEGALATMGAGSMAMRPAGSIGTFIGRRQANNLAVQGRPAAAKALEPADVMERLGEPTDKIRADPRPRRNLRAEGTNGEHAWRAAQSPGSLCGRAWH